jgi:predicted Zn-dependent protease
VSDYSSEELTAIYELGKMYFEMGYFVPAERIFAGLVAADRSTQLLPARLGLGLVKLEQGLVNEAAVEFRAALETGAYPTETKISLAATFVSSGELPRAQSMLVEIGKSLEAGEKISSNCQRLYQALVRRVRAG